MFAEVRAAQCINHTVIVDAGCLSGDLPLVGPPKNDFFTILLCALNVDNFFQIALPVPVRLPYSIMLRSSTSQFAERSIGLESLRSTILRQMGRIEVGAGNEARG